MIPILYLHGFASSPRSSKIALLRPLLEARGIAMTTPDLNVPSFAELDFDAVATHAFQEGKRITPRAIVGSSLGSLVALEVARRGIDVPLVLIAPALGVSDQWMSRIPDGDPIMVFNHASEGQEPIHRAFFAEMATVDADREPPRNRVTVIMGRNDESVPFARVERTWSAWKSSGKLVSGSKFIEIPDGDHGLTGSVSLIASEIELATRS